MGVYWTFIINSENNQEEEERDFTQIGLNGEGWLPGLQSVQTFTHQDLKEHIAYVALMKDDNNLELNEQRRARTLLLLSFCLNEMGENSTVRIRGC